MIRFYFVLRFLAVAKRCQVTFQDLDGLRHSVAVDADSVYEACSLAICALKKAAFVEQQPGTGSKFQVRVMEPVVTLN